MTDEPVPLIPRIAAISLATETMGQALITEAWLQALPEPRYAEFIEKLNGLLPTVHLLLESLAPAQALPFRRTEYSAEFLRQKDLEVRQRNAKSTEEELQLMTEASIIYGEVYEVYVAMINLYAALPVQWAECLLLPEDEQRLLHGHLQLAKGTIDYLLERVTQLQDEGKDNLAALPA